MKIVDVSDWQENVDWQGLVDAGVQGVIIKIGEAGVQQDLAIEHLNNAVAAGLKIGVYYFGRARVPANAAEDAAWVDNFVKEYLNGECPELGIWYDVESGSGMDEVDATACCLAFVNALSEAGYGLVGIYSGYNWFHAQVIDLDRLGNIPVWVAQYNTTNDISDEYPDANILMWQYTDHFSDDLPYDAEELYGEDNSND